MELVTGIGPVTPTLPRWCSTAEPHQQMLFFDWILRWNLVIEKCRFCFTKVVLYRWATPARTKWLTICLNKECFGLSKLFFCVGKTYQTENSLVDMSNFVNKKLAIFNTYYVLWEWLVFWYGVWRDLWLWGGWKVKNIRKKSGGVFVTG